MRLPLLCLCLCALALTSSACATLEMQLPADIAAAPAAAVTTEGFFSTKKIDFDTFAVRNIDQDFKVTSQTSSGDEKKTSESEQAFSFNVEGDSGRSTVRCKNRGSSEEVALTSGISSVSEATTISCRISGQDSGSLLITVGNGSAIKGHVKLGETHLDLHSVHRAKNWDMKMMAPTGVLMTRLDGVNVGSVDLNNLTVRMAPDLDKTSKTAVAVAVAAIVLRRSELQ